VRTSPKKEKPPGRLVTGGIPIRRVHLPLRIERMMPHASERRKVVVAPLQNAARLHGRVSSPEGNRACQGSRPRPHSMAIIAALHDPLTILLTDDLADVVAPHNDSPD
jgi:hypothetical protein